MRGESNPLDIAADWQLSEVSGQPESPNLYWLLERLAGLAAPAVDRKLICRHACQIHVQALLLAAGPERSSYKIKASGNGGYSAKRIKSTSRSAELQRLERAAKSGSLKRWLAAWAGVSHGTLNLVIRGLPCDLRPERAIHQSWVSFSAPGFVTNVPRAMDALPAIIAARGKHQAIAPAERKKRVRAPDMEDFIALTKRVFYELTGRRHGVTRNPALDKYGGVYYELIRDIDARYKTGVIPRNPQEKPTRILRKIVQRGVSRAMSDHINSSHIFARHGDLKCPNNTPRSRNLATRSRKLPPRPGSL